MTCVKPLLYVFRPDARAMRRQGPTCRRLRLIRGGPAGSVIGLDSHVRPGDYVRAYYGDPGGRAGIRAPYSGRTGE
jgi:hypothetical protein